MSRKRYLIGGLAAIVLLGIILGMYALLVGTPRRPMSVEKVNTLIHHDLPLGASAAQVKTWLDVNRIEHSDYGPHHASGADGMIEGIIRDTGRPAAFISADIQIRFTFDKQKRLMDHSVYEVLTGP